MTESNTGIAEQNQATGAVQRETLPPSLGVRSATQF
jgi:hypothetical protein